MKDFIYLTKSRFKLGNTKLEVVRNIPLTGTWGDTFTEKRQKQSKEITNGLQINA